MKQKSQISEKEKLQKVGTNRLVLLNDDFNSFDHVIDCLVSICNHDALQAEQCAVITHFNGNCVIKSGNLEDLQAIQHDLHLYQLQTEIL